MQNILLVDFGSTFTKLCAVDLEKQDIIGTSKSFSTVEQDIRDGFENALDELYIKLGKKITFDQMIACSSAAGGLKMAAIGLVPELTVEASKRTCMGAGAKVDLVFSYKLTQEDINIIKNNNIDIILLSGGTDGGNTEMVQHNIEVLGNAKLTIPIIYAGNKALDSYAEEIFSRNGIEYYITENVMSKLNILNMKGAKETIHQIFLKRIVSAKGINKIERKMGKVILPTPEAVLRACDLLSHGLLDEPGIGELILVDVGGATTDVYSMTFGYPTRIDVMMKGLTEPYQKRTVEGDLGVRYSAEGAFKQVDEETLLALKQKGINLKTEARKRFLNPEFVPKTELDYLVDKALAESCVEASVKRHAGKLEPYYTSLGMVYYQTGKSLLRVTSIIGTGGPIINSSYQKEILMKASSTYQDIFDLRPKNASYYIDSDYILYAMGLLSTINPLLALKIMKIRIKLITDDTK